MKATVPSGPTERGCCVSGFVSSGLAGPPPGRIAYISQLPVELDPNAIASSFENQPPRKLSGSSRIRVFEFDTRSRTHTDVRSVWAMRRPTLDTLACVI